MPVVPRSGVSRFAAIVLAVVTSAWLAACGSSGTTASSTSTSAAPPSTSAGASTTAAAAGRGGLTIKNFMFAPTPLKAKVGDTIKIQNQDTFAHTVAADDGSFDTKDIAASGTATIHLDKAGTFTYHCNIHPFMMGTITVS